MAENTQKPSNGAVAEKPEPPPEGNEYEKVCGIIRPISAMEEYSKEHWEDVGEILTEAIKGIGLTPKLVSEAEEISIIQKTIIQNLYNCPIIVCDISGKNPNVMFELGLRLAFDKPTIIIKDNKTGGIFDISVIEYIEYPSSLHYWEVKDFEEKIKSKIKSTLKKAKDNQNYSPFLTNFDHLVPTKLEEKPVPEIEYIIRQGFSLLSARLENLESQQRESNFLRREGRLPLRGRDVDVRREIRRRSLLREIAREEENSKNATSARMVSESFKRIEHLKNMLAHLEPDD